MLKDLILFPSNSVLYPQGILSPHILEPQHLLMVSDCCRQQQPFVSISFKENYKANANYPFNKIGTLAYIINFDMPVTTILEINCRGRQKAFIHSSRMQKNGLLRGEVEILPSPPFQKTPQEYQVLAKILKKHIQRDGMEKYTRYLQEDWENADWLGCRVGELLPIDQQLHYELFIMEPLERLESLRKIMKNNGWI